MKSKRSGLNGKKKQLDKFLEQREFIKIKKFDSKYKMISDMVNKRSLIHGFAPLNLKLQISVNIGCNATCIMCDTRHNPEFDFSYGSIMKIIDFLDNETIGEVKILGGEPLLDKEGLLGVVKKCKDKNILIAVVTNGYLLDKDYIDALVKNGINHIDISVDAIGGKHDRIRGMSGLFNRIKEAIFYIKE